ncbi:uncharacterized protein LOC133192022 [Saccostrea echinata]|uniref:uncharacterized protein LOC133192022 n=1 Tax=Saccostrea echinata TaxID=191078 RepID=UPI002A81BC0A|nr:uncharacterized protein LOC133192022 [Saccostrea echinata]
MQYSVERRIAYLNNLLDSKAYCKKKLALKVDFETVIGKKIFEATPEDLRLFLIRKDKVGRTRVHDLTCPFLGIASANSCFCPVRLAAGTVSSFIAQFKAMFNEIGRVEPWDSTRHLERCNPADSVLLRRYVDAVKLEQAMSHVSSKQAKPIFLNKLEKLSLYLNNQLLRTDLSVGNRYVCLRDQAFFKVLFYSGDRANDLALCLSQEVKKLSDEKGYLLSHTIGKTLGNGHVNEFVLPKVQNQVICPVEGLRKYIEGSREMGVDLRTGYLFRSLDSSRTLALDNRVTTSAMSDRLKKYLISLDIYEGETTHSFRAGCGITLMTNNTTSSEEIMEHVGWRSRQSFNRYSRINRIVGTTGVADMLAKVSVLKDGDVNVIYDKFGDYSRLPQAFQFD